MWCAGAWIEFRAIPEVIEEAGLVFPEGNVPELVAQLRELHDSPALRKRLGNKGRKRVQAKYSDERIAEQTLDVYCRLGHIGDVKKQGIDR